MTRPQMTLVTLGYLGAAVVMTWPVAGGLTRDLPSDLGDPAFVAGVIAWGAEHWLSLFGGDLSAAARFWHAPIFHPEPFATTYSEHFVLHALLTLPAYALTKNPILSYNLAFLGSFVLAALGVYLLVRDILGERGFSVPAFVAGLAFAFAPYRIATIPHLQVLSSGWMPFVLLGLRRYFRDGNTNGLTLAGAAWWAQNLSSGYYMLFFSPFVALYVVVEMTARRLWRQMTVWRDVGVMAATTVAATLPFAWPYLTRTGGGRRDVAEVIRFSADLAAWLTASGWLHLWGWLQMLPRAEGALFPGATVVVLAALGVRRAWRTARPFAWFAVLALALSFWLTLGPQVQLLTRSLPVPALYGWLWEYVPGFDAARVPARFATIAVLMLAALTGLGLAAFAGRAARWVPPLAGALILMEGAAMPLQVNGVWTSAPGEIAPAEAPLRPLQHGPAVFRYLARLEGRVVVAHFPFGLPEWEIQYGYYAMQHRQRTINGYSGAFPPTYNVRLAALRHPLADPDAADAILRLDDVTHVVIRGGAYADAEGQRLLETLPRFGWRLVARFDEDFVLAR